MKNSLKNRSKQDLYYRKKGFFEINDFLNKKKIFFFIWGGTLLGFKREKNFIRWDWDVEIGLYEKTILTNWNLIIEFLIKEKFKIIYKNKEQLKIEATKYRSKKITKFTIAGWKFDYFTQNYIRKKLSIPKFFFDKMTKIMFSKKWFFCPGPIEDFLDFYYGNWKKPLKTNDKNEYLTNAFLKNNLWNFYIKLDKIKSMFTF